MNKENLTKIKNRIKDNALAAIASVIAVSATAYAVVLKKALVEQSERFPEGKHTGLALNGDAMEKLQKGGIPYWIIDGHEISIAYDPDC